MPYRGANGIAISSGYTPQASLVWPYTPGAIRLDVFVNGTDAVAQFLEEPNSSAWTEDQSTELLFRQGFSSFPAETPFFAVRFRVWSGTALAANGTIDVKMIA